VKVCYSSASYRSHRRQATAYADVLRRACDLVPEERAAEADVIVLHHEPHAYERIYRQYPALTRKYVIGYCVWDANGLPASYPPTLSRLQEIWTPSYYSFAAFAPHHPRVFLIPHIVERAPSAGHDLDRVRAALHYRDDAIYFLSIARLSDTRKNVRTLVDAFLRQSPSMPRAQLIVKISSDDPEPPLRHSQVIWLRETLSDAEITALYRLAHVYVSAHHAEGWGLTLSDAMLLGTPVIATGYSGNLEFMTAENSYLLRCTEGPIQAAEYYAMFDGSMRWAHPDTADLEHTLRLVYENRDGEEVAAKQRRAKLDIDRFSRENVAPRLLERMEAIALRLRSAG
jgi:glycosyltransferase involved in cell wall biosynthesis